MKWRTNILGLLITALFGTSLVITVGYVSEYIDIIGYNTQLLPLFSGIIVGVFLFLFLGSLISLKLNYGVVYGIIISIIFYLVVFETLALSDYVISDGSLILLSVLISGGFMPVSTFITDNLFPQEGLRFRSIFAAVSAVISILAIAGVAVVYELSGQDAITAELTLVGILSIVVLLLLLSQTGRRAAAGLK